MGMHTPGPWVVGKVDPVRAGDEGGYRIDAPGVEQLCYVWNASHRFGMDGDPDHSKPFGDDAGEANARLIAAAPDLLNALTGLVNAVESLGIPADAARAAIARATGDQP